jgi:hypothetical protein
MGLPCEALHKPKTATQILSQKGQGASRSFDAVREKNMFRTTAIGSALATMSALSVTAADACKTCETVILVCGDRTFVGASNVGTAQDIARMLAQRAGKDPDSCTVRPR